MSSDSAAPLSRERAALLKALEMTNQTFADALAHVSGTIQDGDRAVTYQGERFSYEVSATSLLLVAHKGSAVPLLLAPESDYTRQADELGVSEESKIGTADFDEKYVIRDTTGKAKEFLTAETRTLIEALAPFVELEFCDDIVRLLKKPDSNSKAVEDLKSLAALVATLS